MNRTVIFALALLIYNPCFAKETVLTAIQNLEMLNKESQLSNDQKVRLGELYFLTSRCDDVKALKIKEHNSVNCGCGSSCSKLGPLAWISQVIEFKDKISSSGNLDDDSIKSDWQIAKEFPEGVYWATKYVKDTKSQKSLKSFNEKLNRLEVRASQ